MIREAMRGKDMVGLGRVVLSKRERSSCSGRGTRGSSPPRSATPTRSGMRRNISMISRI